MTRPVLVRRALTALVVTAVATLVAVPAAWALFSVLSSNATGVSAAGTLGTPQVSTPVVTATAVTFAITAPPSGPTPAAYRVARTAPTASTSVCTVTGSAGSCTDAAPVAGSTNTYVAYARLGTAWESLTPRSITVVVPSADTTAPVTTASASPAPNGAGWNSTSVTVTLTATDATGVAGTYYTTDGSTPTTSSTAYTAPFGVSATASVRYFSVDPAGNAEAPRTLALKVDAVVPTGAVTGPSAGAAVSATVTVSGSSADAGGSGLASVQPQVQRGSGTWTDLGSPITTGASTWSTDWVTGSVADGSYSLRAVVADVAGNTTTTSAVAVTVQNNLTVSAASTAVAGTPFTVTIRTLASVTGSQPVTVTGLSASPDGTAPTVPTTATFTGGIATIMVTATRSGAQSVTVRTATDGRQGTSGPVVVAPRPQGQLYFTACTGTTVSCPTSSATATVTFPKASTMSFVLARRAADDYGNSLLDAPVSVTLVASSGTLASYSLTLAAGVAASTTQTYTPPGNSGGARTIDATGTTTGPATASARLTVDPN